MNELSRRRLFQAAIVTGFFGTWTRISPAAEGPKLGTARVALEGYDAVAYFTDGHPVKGSSTFSFSFDDATYYFASAEHQKMFAADPDRYAPQYSGYCAGGLSMGYRVAVDPESWAISNGKLYVFSKKGWALFAEDNAGILAKADANWAALKGQH
jgi:YHS domain-containing protein